MQKQGFVSLGSHQKLTPSKPTGACHTTVHNISVVLKKKKTCDIFYVASEHRLSGCWNMKGLAPNVDFQ